MNGTAKPTHTTYACSDLDAHGTPERRYMQAPGDFSGMFTGQCAGSVYVMRTGLQAECSCSCHAAPLVAPLASPALD